MLRSRSHKVHFIFKMGCVFFLVMLLLGTVSQAQESRTESFRGPYSLVTLDNLLDVEIIAEEIFFEKSAEQLAGMSTGATYVAASQTLTTASGFTLSFAANLEPGRYVLGIEALCPAGANSFWASVDGNNIGHTQWGFVLPVASFERTQEPFSVKVSGSHQFQISLRGAAGSQIRKISVYRQEINASLVPPPLSAAKEQQILTQSHPRIFLTSQRIQELKSHYQDSTSPLRRFYRLPGYMPPATSYSGGSVMGYFKLKDTALAYLLTRDPNYLSGIKSWLWQAIAIPVENVGYDLDVAWFMDGVATAYDWLYDELEEDLRTAVRARIKAQVEYLANVSMVDRIGSASHGRFDHFQQGHYQRPHFALALGAAAIYGDDPDPRISEWLLWAWDRLERVGMTSVPHAFQEGPNYMDSALEWVYKSIELYEDFTALQLPGVQSALQGLGKYRLHFILPSWQSNVNFYDTPPMRGLPPLWSYLWEAKRYQDPVVQGFAEKLLSLPEPADSTLYARWRANTALWLDENLVATPFNPADHLAHYDPETETAFTRSGWDSSDTLLAFVSQPYGGHFLADLSERLGPGVFSTPHAQPQQNHFFLCSRGETLAFDPGYTYEKRTRDENTILIDGQGQHNDGIMWMIPSPGRSQFTRFVRQGDVTIMTGDATTAYPAALNLQKFERTLVSVGEDLVVAYDELKSGSPHVFSWLFHHQGTLTTESGKWKIQKGNAQVTLIPQYPAGLVAQASSYTPVYRPNDTPPEPVVKLLQYDSPRASSVHFLVPMILSNAHEDIPQVIDTSTPAADGFAASQAVRVADTVVAFNQGNPGQSMRLNLPDGQTLETQSRVVVARLKNTDSGPQLEVVDEGNGQGAPDEGPKDSGDSDLSGSPAVLPGIDVGDIQVTPISDVDSGSENAAAGEMDFDEGNRWRQEHPDWRCLGARAESVWCVD